MVNFLQPNGIEQFCQNEVISKEKFEKIFEDHYDLKSDQYTYTQNFDQALLLLLTSLNITSCTLYSPIDTDIKNLCDIYFKHIKTINRLESIGQMALKNSVVIFQNPSFPDGKWYDLEELLGYWKEQNCTVILDETYLDYYIDQSCRKYFDEYENIYIIKSLNQFYGSDKFNTTVLISSEQNIVKQRSIINHLTPYEINYLYHSLKDKNFVNISRAVNSKNMVVVQNILQNSNRCEKVYKTVTNFILVKVKKDQVEFFEQLAQQFHIQHYTNVKFLDDCHFGFVITNSEELKNLHKVIKDVDKK